MVFTCHAALSHVTLGKRVEYIELEELLDCLFDKKVLARPLSDASTRALEPSRKEANREARGEVSNFIVAVHDDKLLLDAF